MKLPRLMLPLLSAALLWQVPGGEAQAVDCGSWAYTSPSQFDEPGTLSYSIYTQNLVTEYGVSFFMFRRGAIDSPKPTVIFIHGGTSPAQWTHYEKYIHNIASRGIQVLFIQHNGNIENIKAAFNRVFNGPLYQLWKGALDKSRLMFAGHSFGGGAALNLAAKVYAPLVDPVEPDNQENAGWEWPHTTVAVHSSAPFYVIPYQTDWFAMADKKVKLIPNNAVWLFHIYRTDDVNDHNIANFYYNQLKYDPNVGGARYWNTVQDSHLTVGGQFCWFKANHFLAGADSPYNANYGTATFAKLGTSLAVYQLGGAYGFGDAVITEAAYTVKDLDSNGQSGTTNGYGQPGTVTNGGETKNFAPVLTTPPACGEYNHDDNVNKPNFNPLPTSSNCTYSPQ